jgi:hypothetical protein
MLMGLVIISLGHTQRQSLSRYPPASDIMAKPGIILSSILIRYARHYREGLHVATLLLAIGNKRSDRKSAT